MVNIILRSDFQGAILRGSYGLSGDSDGDAKKATLTAGTGDLATDGWNAFFSLDVGKTDAIKISDRKNRKWIGTGDIRPWGYGNNAQFLGGAYLNGRTSGGVGPNGSVYDDRNVTATNPARLVPLPGCQGLTTIPGQTDASVAPRAACGIRRSSSVISRLKRSTSTCSAAPASPSAKAARSTEIGYSKKETIFSNTPSGVSGSWGYPLGPRNASSGRAPWCCRRPIPTIRSRARPRACATRPGMSARA